MNNKSPTSIDEFRKQLQRAGADYLHTAPVQRGCIKIRFLGTFDNNPVIWNATVRTLAHHNAMRSKNEKTASNPYIDIHTTESVIRNITVGLGLECIDEQTILKTIIMVRKYKRLRIGRHDFGYTS